MQYPVLLKLREVEHQGTVECCTSTSTSIIVQWLTVSKATAHLCFKHAEPKMCQSPKVENGFDNLFLSSVILFLTFFKK